jgi:hypothetical protein
MQQGRDVGTTNDVRGRDEDKHQRADPTHQETNLEVQPPNRPQIPAKSGVVVRNLKLQRGGGRRRRMRRSLRGRGILFSHTLRATTTRPAMNMMATTVTVSKEDGPHRAKAIKANLQLLGKGMDY